MQTSPIQKILVPLDLSPHADAATQCACSVAKNHHAQVEGIAVLDLPEIAGLDLPYHAWMRPEIVAITKERTEDAKRRITDALARFSVACEERGVAYIEAEFQGAPADCILEAASFHDLVVTGLRTYFHFETQTGPGNSLQEILRSPTAPVLAVPKEDGGDWKRVLIAFDGSPNACRTLKEFARFALPYDFAITILMSSEDTERADSIVASAAAYLRAHGLDDVKTLVTGREIGKVIDEDHIESSDLVVAGIHSRRFIKDAFVGSLTKKLIAYGHTPLYLS